MKISDFYTIEYHWMKSSINKYLNQIIHGDSLLLLKEIPSNSIDLIFCDPPYNLQLRKELYRPNQTKVYGVSDNWDKFESYEHYDRFVISWLTECQRILKRTGSIWISGTYHNIYRIGFHLQNLGFHILNDVIWIKSNPTPNFKGVRLTNSHEVLLWCVKNDKSTGNTFNHHFLKKYNRGKQLRSDWFIRTKGKVIPEVFKTTVCPPGERIRKNNGEKLHSVQKPVVLLERIILGCTKKGDIILDPFSGTGTTGYVCVKHGRNYICFEREQSYIKPSQVRLTSLKLSRKDINTRFISDPEIFIRLRSINENYEKPYSKHKKHIDKLIERYLILKRLYKKSLDPTRITLPQSQWDRYLLKSKPDNVSIINNLVKQNSLYKDKFGRKRTFIESVMKDILITDIYGKITPTIFRKLLRQNGFSIGRSNNQYFVYPK